MKTLKYLFSILLSSILGSFTLASCGDDPHSDQDTYTLSTEITDEGNLKKEEEGFYNNLSLNCKASWTLNTQMTFEQNAIVLFENTFVPQITEKLEERYESYMANSMVQLYYTVTMYLKNSNGKVIRSQVWTTPDNPYVTPGSSDKDKYILATVISDEGNLKEEGYYDNLKLNCDNFERSMKKEITISEATKIYDEDYVPQVSTLLEQLYQQYMSSSAEGFQVRFAVDIQLLTSDKKIVKNTTWKTPKYDETE